MANIFLSWIHTKLQRLNPKNLRKQKEATTEDLLIGTLDSLFLMALHGNSSERLQAAKTYRSIKREALNGRLPELEKAAHLQKTHCLRRVEEQNKKRQQASQTHRNQNESNDMI